MTQGDRHDNVPEHVNHYGVALFIFATHWLSQMVLAVGGGQADVGCHGLPEEDCRNVCLRGGCGHEPGTAHFVKLWEHPYWAGCLVRVEVKGLAKDPGPHALPVRGVMAGSSPRQYTFVFSRCSFREKRSLILFLNLSRAGKATSGGPII